MALRIARGLFRLWLVLSVLWIGGVAVVTWRTFPPEIPERRLPYLCELNKDCSWLCDSLGESLGAYTSSLRVGVRIGADLGAEDFADDRASFPAAPLARLAA